MDWRRRDPVITPEAIIEALENGHDRRILALAQVKAVTIQELMEATDTPRSTTYRRVEHLRETGLLRVERGALRAGHAVEFLKSRIDAASLTIEGGEVKATWQVAENPHERLHRLWSQLGRPQDG